MIIGFHQADRRDGGGPRPAVHGAAHRPGTALQDMRVDHRRAHVVVTQQLLHGADVVAVFQQVGGEAVPQGMRRDGFVEFGLFFIDFHMQDMLIEKHQSAERLILGRRRHVAGNRQMGQEPLDLRSSHVRGCFLP